MLSRFWTDKKKIKSF